ncbi:MAG: response regulator [Spirochaetales bacterium]|nr:response regulator [Spirochaetales bacterium]
MKILIVDDSEIIREAIESWLGKYNLLVVGKAGTGVKAIELLKKTNPDIVTLDITMPEMDGLSAMEQMLKIKPDLKIIVISALAAKEVALSAIKRGAASFLVKPFTQAELQEVFEEVMEEI